MTSAVLRSRAWGVSLAVHAAIGLVLALFLGAGHRHHQLDLQPPARLVWVEPAPAARGAPAVATSGEPVLPRIPAPVTAPESRRPEAAAVPPLRHGNESSAALRARSRPVPAPPAATVPTTEGDAPSPEVAVPNRGEDRGVTGGVAGGVTGGLGDAPLRLSAVASPPELLERIVPEYPSRARTLEIEGQVVLEVVLDRTGHPEPDIRVLRSVTLLDQAAVAAVRQWRFRPARDADGRPVRVVMEVPVRFVLR